MNISENDATVAVDAAARRAFEIGREDAARLLLPSEQAKLSQWDDLPPLLKNQWRDGVLHIVWAALEALPEPRRNAWLEGFYANEVGIREEACPHP